MIIKCGNFGSDRMLALKSAHVVSSDVRLMTSRQFAYLEAFSGPGSLSRQVTGMPTFQDQSARLFRGNRKPAGSNKHVGTASSDATRLDHGGFNGPLLGCELAFGQANWQVRTPAAY
jgi:hypothetical protein